MTDRTLARTCAYCGGPIPPTRRPEARYCTPSHARAAEHERRKARGRLPSPPGGHAARGRRRAAERVRRESARLRRIADLLATWTPTPTPLLLLPAPAPHRWPAGNHGPTFDLTRGMLHPCRADEYIASLLLDPCAYCNGQAEHRDHIVPRSVVGGRTGGGYENVAEVNNLTGSCSQCNREKGEASLLLWLASR